MPYPPEPDCNSNLFIDRITISFTSADDEKAVAPVAIPILFPLVEPNWRLGNELLFPTVNDPVHETFPSKSILNVLLLFALL